MLGSLAVMDLGLLYPIPETSVGRKVLAYNVILLHYPIVRLGLPGVFGCSAWTGRISPLASEL